MNKTNLIAITLVLAVSAIGQSKPTVTVADLGWMAGCWEKKEKTAGDYSLEQWTKPAGMMLGLSRSVKNGRVGFFEYLRIIERDASVYYVARPKGAKTETEFKLTSLEDDRVVFENPEHDFPQRLIYRLVDSSSIAVRVEADKEGKPQGFGFTMYKVSCD